MASGCLVVGGAPQAALGAGAGELSGNTVHPVFGAVGAPPPPRPGSLGGGGAVATFSAVSQGSRLGKGVLKFGWDVGRGWVKEDVEPDDDLAVEDDL